MAKVVLTDFDLLNIVRYAVDRRRSKQLEQCYRAIQDWGEDYVRKWLPKCWRWVNHPEEYNLFLKADFIVMARKYLRQKRKFVKVETLLRRLRKLAEAGEIIAYVSKQKGIYKLLTQGDEIEDDAGVL